MHEPTALGLPGVSVSQFDADGHYLGDITDWSSIDLAWEDQGGFVAGSVAVAAGSSALHFRRLLPHGRASWVKVDARFLGLDEVVAGAAADLSRSNQTSRTIALAGPREVIGDVACTPISTTTGSAASIVARQVGLSGGAMLLSMGQMQHGLAGSEDVSGKSLRELWDSLAGGRGEGYRIRLASPDNISWLLDWVWWGVDKSKEIRLIEGRSAELESVSYRLHRTVQELAVAGAAYYTGDAAVTVAMRAPQTYYGKEAALSAALAGSVLAQEFVGTAPVYSSVSLLDRASAETALRVKLAAASYPTAAMSVVVSKPTRATLGLLPRDIISVRFPSEDTGLYSNAKAIVRAKAVRIAGGAISQKLSIELWSTQA